MLFRYGSTPDGTLRKKAHIYTQDEHRIDPALVDPDAVWVVKRLRRDGFHAYIVGGAVRDLLVGRTPNDFDVATDAHPPKIRRMFRSARIIGRRFQIVHVYSGPEKFVEVTTFRSRSAADGSRDDDRADSGAHFGTMEEDAERRDFTINALYYCPIDRQVIDYVGGYQDVMQRRLRTLIPAEASFTEDPVRMIRAAKYASLMGIPVPPPLAGLIRRHRESILSCSRERVTEEVFKILTSGASADIFELGFRLKLFETIFPALAQRFREERSRLAESALAARLARLDAEARSGKFLERTAMFAVIFRDLLLERKDLLEDHDPFFLIQQYLRTISEPLFPSKKDLAEAAHSVLPEARTRHLHAARGGKGHGAAETGGEGRTRGRRRRRGGRGRGRAPRTPA
ncbi:MAG TPA: polynucleotide adenylyltransferase PcnB [Spirochaetia bacterium]|nr:polynucleotide adenylyltransferase PcnB [Spirochaetia bacterium]